MTDNQKNQVAAMNASGMSVTDILKETGLDEQEVTDFVDERNRLNGKTGSNRGKRISAETRTAMIEWFQSGHSISQTAKKFGVDPKTVKKALDSVTKKKENEPAPSPTETSSKKKILHSNFTAKSEICQAPDLVEMPIMLKGFVLGLFENCPVKWTALYGSPDCASVEFAVNGRKYAVYVVCGEERENG